MPAAQEVTPANDRGEDEATAAERERTVGARKTRRVGDLEVPREADRYKIIRYNADGTTAALSIQIGNERVEVFPLKAWPPVWERVLRGWGSGTYRFHWFGPPSGKRKGGAIGRSSPKSFDDPQLPQLPAYRRATPETAEGAAAEGAAAAAVAPGALPSVASTPMGALLGTQADAGGRIDVGTAMVFMQAMAAQERQAAAELEERHRRWRQDDDERAKRREAEHRHDLEMMRERAASERQETAEYWQRMSEASLEVQSRGRGEDVDDEIADMRESLQELTKTTKQSQDMWSKVFEVVAPAVPALLQKFMGPQLAAPKKEGE